MHHRTVFCTLAIGLALVGCGQSETPLDVRRDSGSKTTTGSENAASPELVKCDVCGKDVAGDRVSVRDGKNVCEDCAKAQQDGKAPAPSAAPEATPSAPTSGGPAQTGSAAPVDPAPTGDTATCTACEGTMPKADAVTVDGVVLCQACAEEKKKGR